MKSLLSPREWQMAEAISNRKTNKEIASALNISERTVKFHVSNLLHKLGYTSRQDLFYLDISRIAEISHVELRVAVVENERALSNVSQDLNRLLTLQEKSRELLERLKGKGIEVQGEPLYRFSVNPLHRIRRRGN